MADQWLLKLTVLDISQPEAPHLVEAVLQWVAHRIVVNHDSEFLERATGAATHLTDYSHPPCCLLTHGK